MLPPTSEARRNARRGAFDGPDRAARRADAQGALAVELDDPQRQPHPPERRRREGRRTSGVVRLDGRDPLGALLRCAEAGRSGGGEAARVAGLSRDPISAWQTDPREARGVPRLWRRAVLSIAALGYRRRRLFDRLGWS